jgi:O-antigen ligase
MYSVATQLISKKTIARYNNWVFNIFCLSTLFIFIFSVQAIKSWPPLIGKVAILLACILPAAMIYFVQISSYFRKRKVPKKTLWVLLIIFLGLTSSLLSATPWITLKATGLFVISGPFILVTTIYLFKSTRNQTLFLWMINLGLLCFGTFFLFYDFTNFDGYPNSNPYTNIWDPYSMRNPLSEGASLILLSAGPMIFLVRKNSAASRLISAFSLILFITIILLLAKKGPILSLIIIFLFWITFIDLRFLKLLVGFVLLTGSLLYFSESTLSKLKSTIELNTSVTTRAELIFFGIHIFKQNPIWGIGSRTNLKPYIDNYKSKIPGSNHKDAFHENLRKFKTFENIFLAFLVEMGGLFSITYFGGLLYILVRCLKISYSPSKDIEMLSLVSVIVGFLFISCTFDTLRFPNLNWLFHSLLGLMVNLPRSSIKETPEPS